MADSLRDLVVSLSLNSDNFTANLRSINQQLKEADSDFRLAQAGVTGFENTVSGAQAQLQALQQKFQLQQQAVQQYERALEAAQKKLETSAESHEKLAAKLETAKQRHADLGQQVDKLTADLREAEEAGLKGTSAYAEMEAELESLKAEYAASGQEVDKLEGQLSRSENAMRRNADAVTRANTNLNNARAALRETESQIQQTTSRLERMQNAWLNAADKMAKFGERATAVGKNKIVDEGFGGNRIANWLNERGIKTKRGTTLWRATSVRAMIGNPIDRGQMHLGDTLSEPIEELRIVDDYYFYKAIELINDRGKEIREGRRNPLRTDAGGLLTGIIYCAECGQRLCINHCKKMLSTTTGKREYHWDVYRCYRKLNSRHSCVGQTTYNAAKIEEVVIDIVRSFFARVKRMPQEAQLKAAMSREESTQAKALKDAAEAMDKAAKAVAALEDEALKALTGESRLDLSIINQIMPKQKAALDQAREEYQRILLANQAEEETLAAKRLQIKKTLEWAELFDSASREVKQMIILNIVERVTVGRGYKIDVKLKLTAQQFLAPDKAERMFEELKGISLENNLAI